MQVHKNFVHIVFFVNPDGSHTIAVTFIRHAKTPTTLEQPQFKQLRSQYIWQHNI